jgi:hypothetical protein
VLSTSGSPEANWRERVDHAAAQRPDLQRHQGLDAAVEGRGVDLGVVAPDDAAAGQGSDTLQAGRRRDAERAGQFAVRLARVGLQKADDLRVEVIHSPILAKCRAQRAPAAPRRARTISSATVASVTPRPSAL